MSENKRIHWTELELDTSGPLVTEWNTYCREVGRLLAEGYENHWLLIKGEDIVGIWDTRDDAFAAADQRFPSQSVLVRQILTHEPDIRLPTFMYRCRQ